MATPGAPAVTAGVSRQRLRAQLLSGPPAAGPVEVVGRILAVQAQDGRGFRLAVRARSTSTTAADVERCLTTDRSLVVDWLCRGTLHLVRAEDHAWLHALTTPQVATGSARRLAQVGVSPDQTETGIRVVEIALRDDGPHTRDQLRTRLDLAGVPTARQALVHVLLAASLRGACVRGPVVGTEQAFVHPVDWLGPPLAVDRDVALAELARRYLAGHGPARDRDLAVWAGLPLRDVRRGLAAISAHLVELPDGLLRLRSSPAEVDELPPPRLLGPFDPVLHGWAARDWVVDPECRDVVTSNGVFRPIALVDGRATATWRLAKGILTRIPLPGASVSAAGAAALDSDAEAVLTYLRLDPG